MPFIFSQAIPINQRILALQDEEAQLKAELEEQATLGLLQKQQQQANAAHSGSATSPSLPGLRKSLGLDAGPGVEAAPGSDVGVGPAAVQEEEEEEEELVFNEDGVLDEEERVRRREERMRYVHNLKWSVKLNTSMISCGIVLLEGGAAASRWLPLTGRLL